MRFEEVVKRRLGVYREINDEEKSIISAEAMKRINANKNIVKDRKEKFLEKLPHKMDYMVLTRFGMK